jgi:hypothetical protein
MVFAFQAEVFIQGGCNAVSAMLCLRCRKANALVSQVEIPSSSPMDSTENAQDTDPDAAYVQALRPLQVLLRGLIPSCHAHPQTQSHVPRAKA